ncbi:MAG TPA: SUMF1/EgtB/PvdO family nonheme iron enzyme [Candidatus Cloacimonadota bacterium]|nr:SUMF1/EgtB/PvdO family nonheme iron enzyme [Candidatus Cloacimonadota bacterium]
MGFFHRVAIEYCNRRSMNEDLVPCYSYGDNGTHPDNWPDGWNDDPNNHFEISCNWYTNGYRLPTEMEWMFAALGGNQSQGYTYSGSNTIEDVAWYSSDSSNHTWDVGLKAANELGLYDMSGNVWEFCWDIHADYPIEPQTNPTGGTSSGDRIIRGGCYNSLENYLTVSIRNYDAPNTSDLTFGFRCVRTAP